MFNPTVRADKNSSVFKYVDWFTIILYIVLVLAGMVSIYAASYGQKLS